MKPTAMYVAISLIREWVAVIKNNSLLNCIQMLYFWYTMWLGKPSQLIKRYNLGTVPKFRDPPPSLTWEIFELGGKKFDPPLLGNFWRLLTIIFPLLIFDTWFLFDTFHTFCEMNHSLINFFQIKCPWFTTFLKLTKLRVIRKILKVKVYLLLFNAFPPM